MSYKFHYNEKVKIIHGFYAGNKGVVVDWMNRDVEGTATGIEIKKSFWGEWPVPVTHKVVVGSQRFYKIRIPSAERFPGTAITECVWVLEQHLEKA